MKVNLLTTENLPPHILFSFYVGNDGGFYAQHRALTNGDTEVRTLSDDTWRKA